MFVTLSVTQKRLASDGVVSFKMSFVEGVKSEVASTSDKIKMPYPVVDSNVREVRLSDDGAPLRVRWITFVQLMNFMLDRLNGCDVFTISSIIVPVIPSHSTSPSLVMLPPFRLTAAASLKQLSRVDLILI